MNWLIPKSIKHKLNIQENPDIGWFPDSSNNSKKLEPLISKLDSLNFSALEVRIDGISDVDSIEENDLRYDEAFDFLKKIARKIAVNKNWSSYLFSMESEPLTKNGLRSYKGIFSDNKFKRINIKNEFEFEIEEANKTVIGGILEVNDINFSECLKVAGDRHHSFIALDSLQNNFLLSDIFVKKIILSVNHKRIGLDYVKVIESIANENSGLLKFHFSPGIHFVNMVLFGPELFLSHAQEIGKEFHLVEN